MAKRSKGDSINFSNRKKLNAEFIGKNLKRSNCYNTDFTGSTFKDTSLKGAQFKNCNFTNTHFEASEIVASNLKNSKFIKTTFKNVVFDTVNLEGVNFENAKFEEVIFIHCDLTKVYNLDISSPGIKHYQDEEIVDISDRLKRAVKASKKNELIKQSGVLDSKSGDINNLNVQRLLHVFSEEDLIIALSKAKAELDKPFFTLLQFIKLLK